jgi:hypothetical protein
MPKNEKEKKVRKKPGRKPKKKLYFGPEVQDAIIKYNTNPDNHALRNKIYRDEIHKAFDKLAENIINTFKFTYFDDGFEDVKCEVVAFLVMNIHKYDHTKGSKAFSYFSIVAKNYLILNNNANYKRYKSHDKIESLDYSRNMKDGEDKNFKELNRELIQYFEKEIPNIFSKKKDIDVAFSIIELMKRKDEIENFNKKALYILIREMANVETSYITKVVNELKKHYRKIQNEFYSSGTIVHKRKNLFF